jgi:predicted secreted protein/putative sterol carrier protein
MTSSTIHNNINTLLTRVNASPLTAIRLKDWKKVVCWVVDGKKVCWQSDGEKFVEAELIASDFTLYCSNETLEKVVEGKLPFFMGLWGTGEIQFDGSFADAYKLGYLLMNDKRQRRVIFISHCWLNINPRFPEGAAFPGANVPLIKTLLDSGLGIVQMPCPEYEVLGLEKANYGVIVQDELRAEFRKYAAIVVKQIKDYLAMGFEVVGIMGMNPSPSCGVEMAKGKGTMLGTNRDVSEQKESGIFIDELKILLQQEGLEGISIFGVRRQGAGDMDPSERIALIESKIAD